MRLLTIVLSLTLLIALATAVIADTTPAPADSTSERPKLGSPDQVDNQLESDEAPREPLVRFTFLDPYFEFKQRVKQRYGLGFGVDYTTQAFWASAALGEDKAASGIFRFFGSWELVGKESGNVGAFVFKIEHRHKYTAAQPKFLSFELGYVGIMAGPFNDDDFRVTNLYWRQSLADRRIAMLAGFLDATDFIDIYGLASPWLHFTNLAFSTGSSSLALPNDGLLGLALAAWLTDQVYGIASIGDNASDPTDVFSGFDRFFNVNEYLSTLEIGWTTAKDRAYFDNVHVTVWHSDQKSEVGDPSGWGVNFSATKFVADKVMPFLRGGYAKDAGSLLQKSISVGAGYQAVPGRDLVAIAFNWGQPNETTWGPGLPDQYTFETFWRWWLGARLAVTPSLQWLIDPALNPDEDSIWVFGLRARLAL